MSAPTLDSPKQATLDLVQRLKDDVTFEDIMYELYVLQNIQRGLNDSAEGRTLTHEQARQRLSRWVNMDGGSA